MKKVDENKEWVERITKHKAEFDEYWRITHAIKKYDRKIIKKMLQKGEFTDEQIKNIFEISDFELNQVKQSLKRAGRNIKINVTDDISHMGISEKEYQILEEQSEDAEIAKKYEERLDLPNDKWNELPPNKAEIEFYKTWNKTESDISLKIWTKWHEEGAIQMLRESIEFMDEFLENESDEDIKLVIKSTKEKLKSKLKERLNKKDDDKPE